MSYTAQVLLIILLSGISTVMQYLGYEGCNIEWLSSTSYKKNVNMVIGLKFKTAEFHPDIHMAWHIFHVFVDRDKTYYNTGSSVNNRYLMFLIQSVLMKNGFPCE